MVPALAGKALGSLLHGLPGLVKAPLTAISANLMASGLSFLTSGFGASFADVASVHNLANRVTGEALSMIRQPERIVTAFTQLHGGLFDSDLSDREIFARLRRLDGAMAARQHQYAASLTPEISYTPDLQQRWSGLLNITQTARATLWLGLVQAAAGKDYRTANEVSADQAVLMEKLEENAGFDVVQLCRADMVEAHVSIASVLADLELQLPRIEEIEVYGVPASALAYQLYDSHARTDRLVALNAGQNPILFNDVTQVLRNA